jgi:hypothetical protein
LSVVNILQTLEVLTGIQEDDSPELAVADRSTPLGLIVVVDPAKTCSKNRSVLVVIEHLKLEHLSDLACFLLGIQVFELLN